LPKVQVFKTTAHEDLPVGAFAAISLRESLVNPAAKFLKMNPRQLVRLFHDPERLANYLAG
jgi:hypothetical protein